MKKSNTAKRGEKLPPQQKIVNYYLAKEAWLQKKTGKKKKFINKKLLNRILGWDKETSIHIIEDILFNYKSGAAWFSYNTCPHCMISRRENYSCCSCDYYKIYGKCRHYNPLNPYVYYCTRLPAGSNTLIPDHVIDWLREATCI